MRYIPSFFYIFVIHVLLGICAAEAMDLGASMIFDGAVTKTNELEASTIFGGAGFGDKKEEMHFFSKTEEPATIAIFSQDSFATGYKTFKHAYQGLKREDDVSLSDIKDGLLSGLDRMREHISKIEKDRNVNFDPNGIITQVEKFLRPCLDNCESLEQLRLRDVLFNNYCQKIKYINRCIAGKIEHVWSSDVNHKVNYIQSLNVDKVTKIYLFQLMWLFEPKKKDHFAARQIIVRALRNLEASFTLNINKARLTDYIKQLYEYRLSIANPLDQITFDLFLDTVKKWEGLRIEHRESMHKRKTVELKKRKLKKTKKNSENVYLLDKSKKKSKKLSSQNEEQKEEQQERLRQEFVEASSQVLLCQFRKIVNDPTELCNAIHNNTIEQLISDAFPTNKQAREELIKGYKTRLQECAVSAALQVGNIQRITGPIPDVVYYGGEPISNVDTYINNLYVLAVYVEHTTMVLKEAAVWVVRQLLDNAEKQAKLLDEVKEFTSSICAYEPYQSRHEKLTKARNLLSPYYPEFTVITSNMREQRRKIDGILSSTINFRQHMNEGSPVSVVAMINEAYPRPEADKDEKLKTMVRYHLILGQSIKEYDDAIDGLKGYSLSYFFAGSNFSKVMITEGDHAEAKKKYEEILDKKLEEVKQSKGILSRAYNYLKNRRAINSCKNGYSEGLFVTKDAYQYGQKKFMILKSYGNRSWFTAINESFWWFVGLFITVSS